MKFTIADYSSRKQIHSIQAEFGLLSTGANSGVVPLESVFRLLQFLPFFDPLHSRNGSRNYKACLEFERIAYSLTAFRRCATADRSPFLE
jgi:hypothetical protein